MLDAECRPAALYRWVHDLADYPQWLDLVHRAVPDDPAPANDGPAAWSVELRARVGPLARSKRLRMVRTQAIDNEVVRFERSEVDGRNHSAWVLQARIVDLASLAGGATPSSQLTMTLHYGGGLWSGAVLERVLNDQINKGRDQLKALVESPAGASPAP